MPLKIDRPALPPVVDVACRHLRSKGMYVSGKMNPEVEDAEVGDGHCWCNQTQNVQGPDAGMVGRRLCTPQRRCYQAVV